MSSREVNTGPLWFREILDESSLYTLTILDPDDDDIMPPKGDPLSKEQTDLLKVWIEQGADWPEEVELKPAMRVDFVQDVQPVLEQNCVGCHREGHADGNLRLDQRELAFEGGKSGKAIIPGRSGLSSLYTFTILPEDHEDLMPPAKKDGPMAKDQKRYPALLDRSGRSVARWDHSGPAQG